LSCFFFCCLDSTTPGASSFALPVRGAQNRALICLPHRFAAQNRALIYSRHRFVRGVSCFLLIRL
ncbi:hypothetical protein K0U00_29350, partial [Paenibacillus sepulcri]|nr:hypothetical protein [Paenibacillus sepulcri]